MSEFDFSTLITDRTNADVSTLSALMEKKLDTWTPEELEKFNGGMFKGGYWWTDLNRVTACMEYLDTELRNLGYESGYAPIKIDRPDVPGPGRLPSGYTELEYIESTGVQWVDTGVVPSQTTRLTGSVLTQNNGNRNMWIFGSRNNDLSSRYELIWINSSSELRFYYGEKNYPFNGVGLGSIDFDISANLATVNGVSVSPTPYTIFEKSLYVFSCNSDAPQNETIKQSLTHMKIYDNDKLVRDYVPCKSPSGATGLYDIYSNEFKDSDGPGQFIAGPEAQPELMPNPLDPYTWYESDIPTVSQMAQYLANVSAIRSAFTLPDYAPQTPESMALLTFAKANDIESVLKEVENVIILIISSFWYSGELYSGEV